MHGTYLLAHATTRSLPNVKHALVYNLATTAISPPELTTVGFQFAASPSQMVPFTGTANQLYVYMFGSLCRPSCTSGAPTAGTWLLELTSGGVQVRNATGLDLGGNDLASLDGVLVNGTAFYRVRGTGVSKEIGIYDITNPLAPQFRSATALTGVSVSTSPRIAYGAGVLMVAGGAGASGGDGVAFLSVGTDPTQLTLRGKVLGIGDAIAVAVLSATRAFVSSSRVGVLRLDLSDLDHPKIQGGQEAPNNAITSLSLQRAGQRRCCDGRVSCLNTSPCTSDATCTAPATCQDVNLLLAGESTNISVFELLP